MHFISIEPKVRQFFGWYGEFVYVWRWPLFIIPILLSPILSMGFIRLERLKLDDPTYVFTPRDARWKNELKTFSTLWPLEESKFLPGKSFETKCFIDILLRSADRGSILRSNILSEIERINQWIMYNITISTDDGEFDLTYQDLCLHYDWICGANEHILMLKDRTRLKNLFDLSFPKGGNQDTPIYLGTLLADVEFEPRSRTIDSVGVTRLTYFLKQQPSSAFQYSNEFARKVEKFLLNFENELLKITFAHSQSLQDGLAENAKHFTPNFIVSFTVLSLYTILFSFVMKKNESGKIDWIRSKPFVACAGIFTTLLSIGSGFGLMLLLGISYNVINTIIPFLIIAIGVDDMFIMNACWNQTSQKESTKRRMSHMMSHAGVAVSITNITDILSFAIGCITELPGIQLFCSYACLSVAFCYLYQITFFAGFMAIMGDIEDRKRHCILFYKINSNINEISNSFKAIDKNMNGMLEPYYDSKRPNSRNSNCSECRKQNEIRCVYYGGLTEEKQNTINDHFDGHKPFWNANVKVYCKQQSNGKASGRNSKSDEDTSEIHSNGNVFRYFFSHIFAPILLKKWFKIFACVLYIVFIGFAILGCVYFKEGLNPENLVANNHYIAHYFHELKNFWKIGQQLNVVILNPPNITDPANREMVFETVKSFENTTYTIGREGTVFFLFEYLNYLDEVNAELENSRKIWDIKLRSWLKYTGASNQWRADLKYNETDGTFEAFRFQIAMRNIIEPNDHKLAAQLLRHIADEQAFNVQIYHETFPFADQYLIIMSATIRNIGISLLCMGIVALLLVPNTACCALIICSIISINLGVFGYMTFWGVNLDAISMISIIMSIGFAVDLSAHITYAFVTSDGTANERVINALESLGWPIFQGAASTIAGITILYFVDAYIILTFFKTIWLTMVIGLVHGLIFLPVALSFFSLSFLQPAKSLS